LGGMSLFAETRYAQSVIGEIVSACFLVVMGIVLLAAIGDIPWLLFWAAVIGLVYWGYKEFVEPFLTKPR
jgi:hypothetical protein